MLCDCCRRAVETPLMCGSSCRATSLHDDSIQQLLTLKQRASPTAALSAQCADQQRAQKLHLQQAEACRVKPALTVS
jgi:hypothetical protein